MGTVEMVGVHRERHRNVIRLIIGTVIAVIVIWSGSAIAQTFNSGSTGADGAFNPTCTPTPCTATIPLPSTGIFNFTTINIPADVTVKFTRSVANTPVTMLASGNVTIAGTIDVSGSSGGDAVISANIVGGNAGAGGPGGFDGGAGGNQLFSASGGAGLGPGGGMGGSPGTSIGGAGGGAGFAFPGTAASSGGAPGGPAYGTPSLLPLIGGSGGGGGSTVPAAGTLQNGPGDGGGGGALVIASSATMTLAGTIRATGGQGGAFPFFPTSAGGSGSGGAVRLVATTITGGGSINVSPGFAQSTAGSSSVGRIRVEAFTNTATITFVGAAFIDKPGVVALPTAPSLAITSVAGIASPASPTGSFTSPDIAIPASATNPMTIALAASNIPLGTTVTVTAAPLNGAATSATSTGLAGTLDASTATASLIVPTDQPSVISASATFLLAALPGAGPVFAQGEAVERVRIAALMGERSEVTYITKSGREVSAYALAQAATGRAD